MLTGSAWFQKPWVRARFTASRLGIPWMQFIQQPRMEELVRACTYVGLSPPIARDAATTALARIFAKVDKDLCVAPTRSSITHPVS